MPTCIRSATRACAAGIIVFVLTVTAGCHGRGQVPPDSATAGSIPATEAEELARRFLPAGAELAGVAPTGATAWGMLARTPAVQTIRFWPEGEELVLASYRRDPATWGVMLLGRRGSKWQKLWDEERPGREIERVQLADVLGEGKPQLLIGWDAGPSLGCQLEVLTWTGNGLQQVIHRAYHLLDVADIGGIYGQDGRCELAVWTKDTGDIYWVEVYRWYEGRFLAAPDTYPAYYPLVADYYSRKVTARSAVRGHRYYLAVAQTWAGDARKALTLLAQARGLEGSPSDAALALAEGDALAALGRWQEAQSAYSRAIGDDRNDGVRSAAAAHYGRGRCLLALGRTGEASEEFRLALIHPDIRDMARASLQVAELSPRASELEDFLRSCGPASVQNGSFEKGLSTWVQRNGIAVNVTLPYADEECWSGARTDADGVPRAEAPPRPTVVLIDWGTVDGAEAGGYLAHGIYWWSGERFHSRVFYAAEAYQHGLGITCALTRQAVLAPGRPRGSAELAVVYDEATGGSGSPRPVLYLWRLSSDASRGDTRGGFEDAACRLAWRSYAPDWRNSHGKVTLATDLGRITVESDSWLVPDGKAEIFHESNPGPHRHFMDTWARRDDPADLSVRYERVEARTVPSAYATLVDFVVALSTGAEERAKQLVAMPSLVEEGRRFGLVQDPLGQRWGLAFTDPALERTGPLTITDGPAAGVTVHFQHRGERWLISGFSRDSGSSR